MTVDEKTRLLPKEAPKPCFIRMPQDEDFNNNTDPSIEEYDSYALTREELNKYIDDPYWTRVRCICFSLYWVLCIVALLCSCHLAARALDSGMCRIAFENGTIPVLNNITSFVNGQSFPAANPINTAAADSSGVVLRMLNQPSS